MHNEPGIEYHAHLPLSWQDGQPTPQQITDWMSDNGRALHAIEALEGPSHERDLEHSTGVDFIAARLEAKMDVVLQWVGKLLIAQHPLPPVTDIILGSQDITWKCPFELHTEQFGIITLYLAPTLPMPLILPVQIMAYSTDQARARLLHFTTEVQDALNRTLFRHHRRALQARSGRN